MSSIFCGLFDEPKRQREMLDLMNMAYYEHEIKPRGLHAQSIKLVDMETQIPKPVRSEDQEIKKES